ncbi:MAG: hypothetical protein JST48_11490 [Bacteroidetes bacterium]|nr:hypothetical protein [Bacteroidota bacterium]
MKIFYRPLIYFFLLSISLAWNACAPKEPVVFKGVNEIAIDIGDKGKPILKGNAVFYNPNKLKMKLKSVNINILVDGKKSAEINQHLNLLIPAQADFSAPLTAQLALDGGLLNTVFGFLGGKKYELSFEGSIRIAVHGITIKVPVVQKQEIKMR